MNLELRAFWRKFFTFDWKFGLLLILVICIPRFLLVLQANTTGNYGFIGLIMLASAIVPFMFLSRNGRNKIGLTKPDRYSWLFLAFVAGLAASRFLYYIGIFFYGSGNENWYSYIGRSYSIPQGISETEKAIMFTVVAGTGMIFSPVGEELFFRGIVHSAFEKSIGEKRASLVDSAAFALTHLAHFGIVYLNGEWKFLLMPAFVWVVAMFLVSILFFFCRKRSRSIAGAIVCHAAFNLGMTYCIFYWL